MRFIRAFVLVFYIFCGIPCFAADIIECPSIGQLKLLFKDDIMVQQNINRDYVIHIAKNTQFNKYFWDIHSLPLSGSSEQEIRNMYQNNIYALCGPHYVTDKPPRWYLGNTTCYYQASNDLEIIAIRRGRDFSKVQLIASVAAVDTAFVIATILLLAF